MGYDGGFCRRFYSETVRRAAALASTRRSERGIGRARPCFWSRASQGQQTPEQGGALMKRIRNFGEFGLVMIGFSRRLMMPADSAHLMLFHPDDLAHAAGWPRDWYQTPFAWSPETAAGKLVAWSTGTAGSFAVRLTTGALSAREQAYAGPHWTFPYRVRHGCVYFDNGDALPSEARTASPSDNEDYWVKLPDGDYAVTVTGIEWQAEPGAGQAPDKLSNYVVQFKEARGVQVGLARRPPDIVALSDVAASDAPRVGKAAAGVVPVPVPPVVMVDSAAYYPAFGCADTPRAGHIFTVDAGGLMDAVLGAEADPYALLRHYFVAAPRLEAGAPGVLCECAVLGDAGRDSRFRALVGVQLLALDGVYQQGAYRDLKREGWLRKRTEAKPDDARWAVRCRTWPVSADDAPHFSADELRALLLYDLAPDGYLGQLLGPMAGYYSRQVQAEPDTPALADWIIDHSLPAATGLDLSMLPPNRRAEQALRAYYAQRGERPDY